MKSFSLAIILSIPLNALEVIVGVALCLSNQSIHGKLLCEDRLLCSSIDAKVKLFTQNFYQSYFSKPFLKKIWIQLIHKIHLMSISNHTKLQVQKSCHLGSAWLMPVCFALIQLQVN